MKSLNVRISEKKIVELPFLFVTLLQNIILTLIISLSSFELRCSLERENTKPGTVLSNLFNQSADRGVCAFQVCAPLTFLISAHA